MQQYCPKTDMLLSVPSPAPLPLDFPLAFPERANPTSSSSSSMGDFHHLQLPTSVFTKNRLEKDPQGSRQDMCRSVTETMLKYPIPSRLVSAYRLLRNATRNYPRCLIARSPLAARSSPNNARTPSRVAQTRDCSWVAKWNNLPGFGEERIQRRGHHRAMLPALEAGEHLNGFSMGETTRETPSSRLELLMGSVIFIRPRGTVTIKEGGCGILRAMHNSSKQWKISMSFSNLL